MSFTVLLDGFIVILLVVTIAYASILNQKLRKLRAGEAEMKAAIERFGAATAQAEANLARYKEIAAEPTAPAGRDGAAAGKALAPLVVEARKLAADLNLLIGRGESLIAERAPAPKARTTLAAPSLLRPNQVAGPRAGRVDRANPAATWPLDDDELELIDALKDAR
jgi:Domain of unknown function (DUF6468)